MGGQDILHREDGPMWAPEFLPTLRNDLEDGAILAWLGRVVSRAANLVATFNQLGKPVCATAFESCGQAPTPYLLGVCMGDGLADVASRLFQSGGRA